MPGEVLVATEAELRRLVPLEAAAIDIVQAAFVALSDGGAIMPPVLSMELDHAGGEVDVKTAFLPGFDSFALKVSTGFYGNAAMGLGYR